ncbi:MAG TPA: hypothetical protein VFV05_15760 [Methylomirabilota bacterium]|nr:hypothetical protein [Methylomirabilota bacterium]
MRAVAGVGPRAKAQPLVDLRGHGILRPQPEAREPPARRPDDVRDQLLADPESPIPHQDVQVPHAADVRPRGVGVDVEPADADDARPDSGDEQPLARAVEPVGAAGPLVGEAPDEAEPVGLALDDEGVQALGRRGAQPLDAGPRPITDRT